MSKTNDIHIHNEVRIESPDGSVIVSGYTAEFVEKYAGMVGKALRETAPAIENASTPTPPETDSSGRLDVGNGESSAPFVGVDATGRSHTTMQYGRSRNGRNEIGFALKSHHLNGAMPSVAWFDAAAVRDKIGGELMYYLRELGDAVAVRNQVIGTLQGSGLIQIADERQPDLFRDSSVASALLNVESELLAAVGRHAPMNSAHEAYAVIREELDEAWEEIKKREPDKAKLKKEFRQVAAMAIRAIIDLKL